MHTDLYITSTCSIAGQNVYKNGKTVFTGSEPDPRDLLAEIYKHFDPGYPRFYKMDALSKLGWLTSEILLKDNFDAGKYQPEQIGLVLCNANSSLDTDVKYLATTKELASPSVFVYTLPNIMIGEICIRNHFKGESFFFIAEKPDVGFLHHYVSGLFGQNILQACICGWVELLGNEYRSVLCLVEKQKAVHGTVFNAENFETLFQQENK